MAYALKRYEVPRANEPTDWLKLPVPLPMDTWLTPVPPISGLVFTDDREYTTPRPETVAPPSAVTSPPKVTELVVIEAAAVLLTVGATMDPVTTNGPVGGVGIGTASLCVQLAKLPTLASHSAFVAGVVAPTYAELSLVDAAHLNASAVTPSTRSVTEALPVPGTAEPAPPPSVPLRGTFTPHPVGVILVETYVTAKMKFGAAMLPWKISISSD